MEYQDFTIDIRSAEGGRFEAMATTAAFRDTPRVPFPAPIEKEALRNLHVNFDRPGTAIAKGLPPEMSPRKLGERLYSALFTTRWPTSSYDAVPPFSVMGAGGFGSGSGSRSTILKPSTWQRCHGSGCGIPRPQSFCPRTSPHRWSAISPPLNLGVCFLWSRRCALLVVTRLPTP